MMAFLLTDWSYFPSIAMKHFLVFPILPTCELVSPFPRYSSRFFSVAFGSHSRLTSQSMNSTSLIFNDGFPCCFSSHVQIGRRSSAISLLTLWDLLESPVVWLFPLWEPLGILLFLFVHSRGIWTAASTLMGGCVKAPRIRSKNLIRYHLSINPLICVVSFSVKRTPFTALSLPSFLSTKCQLTDMTPITTGNPTSISIRSISPHTLFSVLESVWDCPMWRAGECFSSAVNCSLSVGICGSSCALSDAQDGGLFSKMLIAQIFASALGIYGIIVGIIVSNMGAFPK